MKLRNCILNVLVALFAMSAGAEEITFTYDVAGSEAIGYGYGRADESYDICVKIDNPELAGTKIKGFEVVIPSGGKLADEAYGWVAAELPAEAFSSENTLQYISAVVAENKIKVEFPKEIEIGGSGLYAGYTVRVAEVVNMSRKFPVATVEGNTPGSLYLRTTTHPNWDAAFSRLDQMSSMRIALDGKLSEKAAALEMDEKLVLASGKDNNVAVKVVNQGKSEISKAKYILTSGFDELKGELTFNPPIPALFGSWGLGEIVIKGSDELGNSEYMMELTEIDGEENMSLNGEASGKVRTIPTIPVKRPLLEEYTGLWCGQCPSGWVALETGRAALGEDFVAISYHVNDVMQTTISHVINANAVPMMYFDRFKRGSTDNIVEEWKTSAAEGTDVDVKVELSWTDKDKRYLRAKATTTFMENHPGSNYTIGLALVADKLKNASWGQTNYYSGQMKGGEFWKYFSEGGAVVYGLEFNDIALIFDEPRGKPGSFPSDIKEFTPYHYEEVFDLSKAVGSKTGQSLVQNKDNLRVIAIVVDTRGGIANSVSSVYSSGAAMESGVEAIEDAEEEIEEYYDLLGVRMQAPRPGVPMIRKSIDSKGDVKVDKIIYQ